MKSHKKLNKKNDKQKERKIQRQTRSGNSSPLHYITPVFNTRSTLTSSTAKTASSNYPNQNSVAAAAAGATGSGGGGVGASANMGSPYYRDMDEPTSPAGGGHHRSRSASRPPITHSMDYPSKYFCYRRPTVYSKILI